MKSNVKAICLFWTHSNGQLSHCLPQKWICNSLQSIDCIEVLKNNCNDCYLTVSQIQFWITICCNSNCWYAEQIKHYCNCNNPWQICQKVLCVANEQFWLNKTVTMCPSRRQQLLQMRSCWTFLRSNKQWYTNNIQWIAVISVDESIVNNDNFVQFVSSSGVLQ